jgi:energy-coupling factor transport system substrate-specific component
MTQPNALAKKRLSRRTVVSLFIILILAPLTIIICWKLGDRKYYIASVLIIFYTMVPFFTMFENRRPQARELTVIAVLCVIAVVSRAAFIMLPHFKPMTAIIIIAGVTFGAEAGFLTGAVSGFASNFIFGQGPWTPWQMFAYGMAGLIAGLLYNKGLLSKKPVRLSIFGALVVMLVVGPLLDTCALFTMSAMINTTVASGVYLAGLPVNAVHASATVLTLLFLSKPMFEKLDRIKCKYGLLEDVKQPVSAGRHNAL